MSILNEAREKFGFMNIWTYNGQILYKDDNDGANDYLFRDANGYH